MPVKKGQIIKPIDRRFEDKIFYSPDGCWYWIGARSGIKYGHILFNGKIEKAHRVSYIMKHGQIKDNLFVCHSCDNKICVNPDHLFLGTNEDNMIDMARKGRSCRGEKARDAKITESQVLEIRSLKGAIHYKEIVKRYNIAPRTVHSIWSRETWRHI